MEFEQQQFEDFFSGPKKIRVKAEERVRRHCASGGVIGASVAAAGVVAA
jgi:hypothetical protein